MKNRYPLYPAGTKKLTIEITVPDLDRIIVEGGHVSLEGLEVNDLRIDLNKRFVELKGDLVVRDGFVLNAKGGVVDLEGSAKNLEINSGDCWIDMENFTAETASINAVNTSRLNVYVTENMEVISGVNSGIVKHFDFHQEE
ncbi:DUF2807 domain-containing protein [Candidatus Uhrbacteria bacterium]|nr:DUF2807 domain-containing protein [Candidatus Uhrbacteria bacterium]